MEQLKDIMRNKKYHFIMYIGLVLSILLTVPTAVCGGVYSDAYSYEDDFENTLGLDMAASEGFAVGTPAKAVSQCIQPKSSKFQGWSHIVIDLEVVGEDDSLTIKKCDGGNSVTFNLSTGINRLDLSDEEFDETGIRLEWTTRKVGAKANSWIVYEADGIPVFSEDASISRLDTVQSNGFEISDGMLVCKNTSAKLVCNNTSGKAVSQCIKLVQPEGATFQEWSYLEIDLEDAGYANKLCIQNCKGNNPKVINDLVSGTHTIDLCDIDLKDIPSNERDIQLKWTTEKEGARAISWKVYGKAEGPTVIDVVPDIETVNVGDTVMFTIRISSSGAKTRNPVLRFSLDAINAPGGLAEDGEYRPLEFVSASNGPDNETPKMIIDDEEVPVDQASGSTSGEVVWNLKDMPDGFSDNVTVTLKIPKGYINGKTLKAGATLEHGMFSASRACNNRMIEDRISGLVTVKSVHDRCQATYTPYDNVGPGAKNILDRYSSYNGPANSSDIEDVTFTITGIGDCMPIFKEIRILDPDSKEYVSKPVNGWVSEPIIGSDSIIVHFDRIDFYHNSAFFEVIYDVPDGCSEGDTIGTQSHVVGGSIDENGNRQWNEQDEISHPVVVKNCRGGVGYVHRVMSGNDPGDYKPWPGYSEYYIGEITDQNPQNAPGSLRAGEFFTTWAPYSDDDYRTHTIPLDHSYNLTEIPEGITFHGVPLAYSNGLARLYKDCTGAAPVPTDPDFDHNAVHPHPAWKPVDITWNGSPFSTPPDEEDSRAVVLPGCRLLGVKDNDKPAWMKPDYAKWRPYFLWRVCDGSYGCEELPEGTAMSLVGGHIYTYENGTVHDCESDPDDQYNGLYEGQTVYKQSRSWPKVHAWPEQNQVPAGKMASIIINPENSNHASQYVDGRWVVNLYEVRKYIDFKYVTGEVLAIPKPDPDQNVKGEICDNIAGKIKFHFPDSECMNAASADDANCMAWWEVPAECQPPNGWGYREIGNKYRDDYVQMYQFRLKAKVLETTPANTVLNFVAEVRTNNLTARGADNAVADTNRWPHSNYAATASVTVLETPGLDITTEGPVNQKAGNLIYYNLQLENSGNTPENGWYIVDWLPRKDVNGSQFTPVYGKLYVDWLRKIDEDKSESDPKYRKLVVDRPAEYVIVEYSTNENCFANPLDWDVHWDQLGPLQQSPGTEFQAETQDVIKPDAVCIRLRKNPNSASDIAWDFIPDDMILSAFEVKIPIHALDGQRICNRALTGASSEFLATSDIDPVETVNYCTEVNDGVAVSIEKKTKSGGRKWTIKVRNESGTVAENIRVEDDLEALPETMTYQGIDGALPPGWQWAPDGEPGIGTRGKLIIIINKLDPYDGYPDSGDDEGSFTFLTNRPSGSANVKNCATAIPENGLSSATNCALIESLNIIVKKTQDKTTDRISSTEELDLFPEDEFTYEITVENKNIDSSQSVYLTVTDTLDPNLEYVDNTFTINNNTATNFYAFFSDNTLCYPHHEIVDPDQTLTLSFDVKVKAAAPHGYLINNRASALPCAEWGDMDSCSFLEKSNEVSARVVNIQCDFGLQARANRSQVQLTWTPGGTYDVYRSTEGPDSDYQCIAADHYTDWATYLDSNVQTESTYYYYVVDSNGCRSEKVSITPKVISDVQNTFNLDVHYNPASLDVQNADNSEDNNNDLAASDTQVEGNPVDDDNSFVAYDTKVDVNWNDNSNNVFTSDGHTVKPNGDSDNSVTFDAQDAVIPNDDVNNPVNSEVRDAVNLNDDRDNPVISDDQDETKAHDDIENFETSDAQDAFNTDNNGDNPVTSGTQGSIRLSSDNYGTSYTQDAVKLNDDANNPVTSDAQNRINSNEDNNNPVISDAQETARSVDTNDTPVMPDAQDNTNPNGDNDNSGTPDVQNTFSRDVDGDNPVIPDVKDAIKPNDNIENSVTSDVQDKNNPDDNSNKTFAAIAATVLLLLLLVRRVIQK